MRFAVAVATLAYTQLAALIERAQLVDGRSGIWSIDRGTMKAWEWIIGDHELAL